MSTKEKNVKSGKGGNSSPVTEGQDSGPHAPPDYGSHYHTYPTEIRVKHSLDLPPSYLVLLTGKELPWFFFFFFFLKACG